MLQVRGASMERKLGVREMGVQVDPGLFQVPERETRKPGSRKEENRRL